MTDVRQNAQSRRLTDALAEFQASIPRVAKDAAAIVQTKTGGTYGYKYADLASLTQIALPLLAKLGLSFTCCPTVREDGKFVLSYALRFGGESIGGDYPLPSSAVPQAIGSAITYGRRYCLCAVTGIAPDEDDDDAAEWPANKDGSLSHSRMSDEQRDAAGIMTSEQQKAHTALQPKKADGLGQHLTVVPPDDPFYGYEPTEAERLTYASPATITKAQQSAMHAKFHELNVKDRDKRLNWTRLALELPDLASSSDLSHDQAARLLELLERASRTGAKL